MARFPEHQHALPTTQTRQITRVTDGRAVVEEDVIATEYALTIYVNSQEMATIVCTPDNLEDLVIGFLASEGVIRSIDQIQSLTVSTFRGTARVQTDNSVNFNQAFYNKRYIASCCGKSRQGFYFFNDAQTAKRVDDPVQFTSATAVALMDAMEREIGLFQDTGGVHTAAICDAGGLLVVRSDIGRHNALDKLFGYVLRTKLQTVGKFVAFSGRISSEVLLKVAKIGIGVVLAKSAPTALAIDMAQDLGITAVGFIRGASFNIYTHPERFKDTSF